MQRRRVAAQLCDADRRQLPGATTPPVSVVAKPAGACQPACKTHSRGGVTLTARQDDDSGREVVAAAEHKKKPVTPKVPSRSVRTAGAADFAGAPLLRRLSLSMQFASVRRSPLSLLLFYQSASVLSECRPSEAASRAAEVQRHVRF